MKHYCNQIIADNFNDLFLLSANAIIENGKWITPRGLRCKELISAQLVLTNPKNCLITLEDRRLNYAYLTIEKMMYLSQFCNPEILIAYNNKMRDFLNLDKNDFDGAYGPRIAENFQLDYCFKELKSDPDSRRAVVTIHNSTDCRPTKDSACTLNWHFMIRDGKLDMIVDMRSNDILWGTCLDVPAFAFIQEVMAKWLKIPIGNYIHNNSSLHFYDTIELDLIRIIHGTKQLNNKKIPEWDISYEDTPEALQLFWQEEKRIREERDFQLTKYNTINAYLLQLLNYWKKKDENKKKNEKFKRVNEQQGSAIKENKTIT
jgi:thymidylate synthase